MIMCSFLLHEIKNVIVAKLEIEKKTSVKKKIETSNLTNLKFFMRTWKGKASWIKEHKIGFHGSIKHWSRNKNTVEWHWVMGYFRAKIRCILHWLRVSYNSMGTSSRDENVYVKDLTMYITLINCHIMYCYINISVQCMFCFVTWSCNLLCVVK